MVCTPLLLSGHLFVCWEVVLPPWIIHLNNYFLQHVIEFDCQCGVKPSGRHATNFILPAQLVPDRWLFHLRTFHRTGS